MKSNIILIGYMGCGKSTIGRKMANILSMPFLDTDQWIEEKEGITISELFATKGEAYFRELETECLKELLQNVNLPTIISVGGGLPVREENQRLLKQLGRVIYLKATSETIFERLKGDTTRPLLQTENPLQRIKDMLSSREEKYLAAAHEMISVDGKSVVEIVGEIVENER